MRHLHSGDLNLALDTKRFVVALGISSMSESPQTLAIQEDLEGIGLIVNSQVETDLLFEGEMPLSLLVAPASALLAVSDYLFLAKARIEVEENITIIGEEIHAEVALWHSIHVNALASLE